MIFGYARDIKESSYLSKQVEELENEGCDEIYTECTTGKNGFHPELDNLLFRMRKDDILIVYKLDRLGLTTKELLKLMIEFKQKGIHIKCLIQPINTLSEEGNSIYDFAAILKSTQTNVLTERTMHGLKDARANGKIGGNRLGQYNEAKADHAAELYQLNKIPIEQILKMTGIGSKSTLYRYLRIKGVKD